MNPFGRPVNAFTALDTNTQKAHKEVEDSLKNKLVAVFANPMGLDLLDYLDDVYLSQPVVVMGAPPEYSAIREGENRFIRMIRTIVNNAQQG